jgi:hypothetical protein
MVFLAIPNSWTGINWLFAGTLLGLTILTHVVAEESDKRFQMDNGEKLLEAGAGGEGLNPTSS